VSRANASSGHGIGTSQVVEPIPRLSKVVLRNSGSKKGIWYGCQSEASPPPPETHTMSGPSPCCSW
jgi:hypothetical protein